MNECASKTGRLLKVKVEGIIDLGMFANDPMWNHSHISNPGHFLLSLKDEWLASNARPGQFIHILPPHTDLLRRPISIFDVNEKEGTVRVLFRVIGEGTRALSKIESGDTLDIIGPLGNGFPIDTSRFAIIVGGGVGIPPLYSVAFKFWMEGEFTSQTRKFAKVFLGARNTDTLLCVDEFEDIGFDIAIATEDGSFGTKGLITDLLKKEKSLPKDSVVYACGPIPMLAAVAKWAKRKKFQCWVSLENKLGCGVGACLGCSIPICESGKEIICKRVCFDGPVFDASKVAFDLM